MSRSVGNHEFDQGYADLVDRVMAPYDPTTNPEGGAEWEYIAANVRLDVRRQPRAGADVDPGLRDDRGRLRGCGDRAPAGAGQPGRDRGDLRHRRRRRGQRRGRRPEGRWCGHGGDAGARGCAEHQLRARWTTTRPRTSVRSSPGVNDNIDAIVSGHTHLEYNCSFPVPLGGPAVPVTERPVVSAGQYGAALNQLVFTVDAATGRRRGEDAVGAEAEGAPTAARINYPVDAPTQAIVDAALAEAAVLGAVPLGEIAGPIKRGYLANGTTENRGVESTLGNLVAEAQRWQTSEPGGGFGADRVHEPGWSARPTWSAWARGDPYPRTLTYKQAAEVQPFANGLVNMDLTGAQIKAALEQQWQPGRRVASVPASWVRRRASPTPPTRTPRPGSRITGMWLDGVADRAGDGVLGDGELVPVHRW